MNIQQWTVITTECFNMWLFEQDDDTQDSVLASLGLLQSEGPLLSRPYADTVKGSQYANMKELRIQHQGKPIRAFFAFDPLRQAIVLCAGDKSNDKKFCDKMLRLSDAEFTAYLSSLEQ
ncbi:type II toxin-antitoxin system RelE/ParE family toxin [Ursidibacter arcticus]